LDGFSVGLACRSHSRGSRNRIRAWRLPAADPRIRGSPPAIEERLLIDGEFVLWYESENPGDDLPAGEGAFLACSFWLFDNYFLQSRYPEARNCTNVCSRAATMGLLAEELDPLTGRMLGNFPQAYSHVGLVNCALNLSRQMGPGGGTRQIAGAADHRCAPRVRLRRANEMQHTDG
jgi:GH15 family glucan-1,4-alpha-glucosidase